MLKGRFQNPGDYPNRETALAIVEALKTVAGWKTVAEIVGITGDPYGNKTQATAHNCYLIYGFPELEQVALARWTAEASLRPNTPTATHTGSEESREDLAGTRHPTSPIESPTPSYGLTRR